MSTRIISPRRNKRKQPTPPTPPAKSDLVCPRPRCRATAHFSSTAQRVWCGRCPWALTLTPEQTEEIAAALNGIIDLNVPAYLVVLQANAEEGGQPPPPLDHLTTIYLRRAILALDTGVAA